MARQSFRAEWSLRWVRGCSVDVVDRHDCPHLAEISDARVPEEPEFLTFHSGATARKLWKMRNFVWLFDLP